ncbi:MAG: hypothetical protein Q9226_004237 [Calogaya cf. arnoldii]
MDYSPLPFIPALLVAAACTFNACFRLAARFRGRKTHGQPSKVSIDEDTIAQLTSLHLSQAGSIAPQPIAISLLSVTGLLLSVVPIASKLPHGDAQYQYNIRLLSCLQPASRFNLSPSLWNECSWKVYDLSLEPFGAVPNGYARPGTLSDAVQTTLATLVLLFGLTLPRGPSFKQAVLVDREHTTSIWNRLTHQWSYGVLRQARAKNTLDLEDLPLLRPSMFSQRLHKKFRTVLESNSLPLWKIIFLAHWPTFLQQYALSILQSAAQLAPQFAMYSLLRIFEVRQYSPTVDATSWFWVATLGLSMIFAAWIETQSLWIMWSRLVIPIRSEMSSLIFSSAMQKKDLKSTQSKDSKPSSIGKSSRKPISSGSSSDIEETRVSSEGTDNHDDRSTPLQETQVSSVNLVGVDAQRVIQYVGASYLIPSSLCSLVISIAFLCKLIGWQSILAVLFVLLAIAPLNFYVSNLMIKAQSQIMQVRDEKISVINEALQGIRQIKFSASEQQWRDRIRKKRDRELQTQLYSFVLRTALVGIWALGPVVISAVALTVYTLIYGQLSPSVAFTSIALLSQIEGSLGIIPALVLKMLEAAVSASRIGHYLNSAKIETYLEHDESVLLIDASVSWPTAKPPTDSNAFSLRGINVKFPPGKLSIISGDTGSGKSLLLAAIIGEGENSSGRVRSPGHAPESASSGAQVQGRIIPEATAFVAQVPWIENDSIRNNIVFGLPFEPTRYSKVLTACALTQDLQVLPDADLTEVGVGGINLSGGQKWRLSFARALYSRAGILVLDDIFSALDTHVGRHILEKALCGELGHSRTRILATHHTDLCIPWAQCHVVLENGSVASVQELSAPRRRAIAMDQVDDEPPTTISISPLQNDINSPPLQNIYDDAFKTESNLEQGLGPPPALDACLSPENHMKTTHKPRKFVEAEAREIGSVSFRTYKEYIAGAGGLWIVVIVLLTHAAYMASILGRDSDHTLRYYVGVYLGLSVIICFLFVIKFFSVLVGSIKASRVLFEGFDNAIFHAPIRWLDVTPIGRILNRYTADFNAIDESLADGLGFFINQVLQLAAIVVAGVILSPIIVAFAAVLLLLCIYIARLYLPGARDVKRIESVTRSPIFELLESASAGVGTIRAYKMSDVYIQR